MIAQLQFPIRAEKFCVLLPVNSVRDRLADFDLDEDSVIAACADHSLAPAIDIGLGGRAELRIVPSAVTFYDLCAGARSRRILLSELFAEVLRGVDVERPALSGERARAILNCSGGQMNALVDIGELSVLRGTERRRGPNGSDQITLASFKDFLKRRLQ